MSRATENRRLKTTSPRVNESPRRATQEANVIPGGVRGRQHDAHHETSVALTILGAYLAVTAIPATMAVVRGGALAPAATHYAATVAVFWIRSRQTTSTGMWRLVID